MSDGQKHPFRVSSISERILDCVGVHISEPYVIHMPIILLLRLLPTSAFWRFYSRCGLLHSGGETLVSSPIVLVLPYVTRLSAETKRGYAEKKEKRIHNIREKEGKR